MALMKCPECGKEISDKAAACPHCGCPLSDPPSSSPLSPAATKAAQETPVGPLTKKPFAGVSAIIAGIFGLLSCLIFPPLGIMILIGCFIMIGVGMTNAAGYYSVTCPHCHASGQLIPPASGYTCHACHKRSIYDKAKSVLRTVD